MIRNKLNKYIKSEYLKNIIVLATGTSISQVIPLLISPLVTRLFTPEEFGIFALYISLCSLMVNISTGAYEQAALLPKNETKAIAITVLSISISFVFCFVLFFLILFFSTEVIQVLNTEKINKFIYLIPLSIWLTSSSQSIIILMNRYKKYSYISKNRILQVSSDSSVKIGLGLLNFKTSGLVFGCVVGQIIGFFHYGIQFIKKLKEVYSEITKTLLISLAKRYSDFPKFRIPSLFLNNFTFQVPVFLLSGFYGVEIVGFFALAQRVFNTPMRIISRSIWHVFIQQAKEDFDSKGNCKSLFDKTTKNLARISIIPFILIFLVAPKLFPFIFGENWSMTGKFIQVITIFSFFRFIAAPMRSLFIITEHQREDLVWQICYFIGSVIAIYLGYILYNNSIYSILFYALNGAFFYVISYFITKKYSYGKT